MMKISELWVSGGRWDENMMTSRRPSAVTNERVGEAAAWAAVAVGAVVAVAPDVGVGTVFCATVVGSVVAVAAGALTTLPAPGVGTVSVPLRRPLKRMIALSATSAISTATSAPAMTCRTRELF